MYTFLLSCKTRLSVAYFGIQGLPKGFHEHVCLYKLQEMLGFL